MNSCGRRTSGFISAFFILFILDLLLWGGHTSAAEPRGGWQIEWARTVESARKEGRLTVYGSEELGTVFQEFEKKFPEIRVTVVSSGPGQTVPRLAAERRAGKYLADLASQGTPPMYDLLRVGFLSPIKPLLLLPEVTDESRWRGGKHKYKDPEGKYFVFGDYANSHFIYNTNLVNPKEIRSYWELLSPKWKGKIVAHDPTSQATTTGIRFLYYHPELGPEFLRRFLTETNLATSRDERLITDWIATGKYAVGALVSVNRIRIDRLQKQGLPLGWFGGQELKEGIAADSGGGNLGLVNRAPHANAATVAVNWLLSREGQILVQRVRRFNSLRTDIPKDDVPAERRLVEGGKYLEVDLQEYMDMEPVNKLVQQVWKK